jgi:pyridoxamine 5'-phosphate oxidase family protein
MCGEAYRAFAVCANGESSMSFTAEERDYLASQPLARLATVAVDGQPDVVPVSYEFDGTRFWVGGPGASVLATRKFRNVLAGQRQVALVMDDMVSFDPFIARGIRIYGRSGQPVERVGARRARDVPADRAHGLVELEPGRSAGR